MRIRLTEGQLQRIKNISEGYDNRYNKEVKLKFNYHNVTYKGYEINDVSDNNIRVSYDIEIDARSWGIKSISLYSITGPDEIEIEVDYFVDENNTDIVTIPLKLDWSKAETNKITETSIITVGEEIEVYLKNDENGNIFVESINIEIYTL